MGMGGRVPGYQIQGVRVPGHQIQGVRSPITPNTGPIQGKYPKYRANTGPNTLSTGPNSPIMA